MVKKDIWDVIFWIGMIILILYIIGKLTGLIHSPEWLNLLPIISLAFVIGAFYHKVTSFMNTMNKRTNYLKNSVDNIQDKLTEHEVKLVGLRLKNV